MCHPSEPTLLLELGADSPCSVGLFSHCLCEPQSPILLWRTVGRHDMMPLWRPLLSSFPAHPPISPPLEPSPVSPSPQLCFSESLAPILGSSYQAGSPRPVTVRGPSGGQAGFRSWPQSVGRCSSDPTGPTVAGQNWSPEDPWDVWESLKLYKGGLCRHN